MVRVHAALFPCKRMENMYKGELCNMAETKCGTVKWFSAKKGYGFVTGEDGEDYFAHFSQIKMEALKCFPASSLYSLKLERTKMEGHLQ